MTREYDVIIVGAGPAGLFAAYEIAENSNGRYSVLVIDKGPRAIHRRCPLLQAPRRICTYCKPCMIMYGVGGAGTLSSGLINLRPDVGGDLHELMGSWEAAQKLVDYVDQVFLKFGAPKDRLHIPDPVKVKEIERRANRVGAKFIPIKQRHIGSDNAPWIIENMTRYLEKKGIRFQVLTEVKRIEKAISLFRIYTTKGVYESRIVLLAPGRSGAEWFKNMAKKLGVEMVPGPLDVGVRVEVPAPVMEPLTNVVMDPKIILYTRKYDDRVRTFCTNHRGYVVKEVYDDGTVAVNGETYTNKESMNTNFAFLVTIQLTDPMEDTIEYGKSIARIATRLGGGKPLIQRLGDLEQGRRSTWVRIKRSTIEPTLRDVTPGDISMALPHRVVEDIIEGLYKLDKIAPGVASPQTLLYAIEIKYYSMKAIVDEHMQTSVDGLYVAGDGAGLSRGINIAAATGVLAGRGILLKLS